MSQICPQCLHDCTVEAARMKADSVANLDALFNSKSGNNLEKARVLTGVHLGILIAPHIKAITHVKLQEKGYSDLTSTIGSWGMGLAALATTIAILGKLSWTTSNR